MASRKLLKKCIKEISIDLISECYVRFIFNPKAKKEINAAVNEINSVNYDLVMRIAHTDGKNNPKITREYYQKLKSDWHKSLSEIIEKINAIPMN